MATIFRYSTVKTFQKIPGITSSVIIIQECASHLVYRDNLVAYVPINGYEDNLLRGFDLILD